MFDVREAVIVIIVTLLVLSSIVLVQGVTGYRQAQTQCQNAGYTFLGSLDGNYVCYSYVENGRIEGILLDVLKGE